jgi:tetratricopeptide (TPR) repeat protein
MAAPLVPQDSTEQAYQVYARLTLALHNLIAQGKGDSSEAEAVADELDAPWHHMNERERARVRGLSRDLYALAEGGRRVAVTNAERLTWAHDARTAFEAYMQGDCDAALEFLRRPSPLDAPPFCVPFLQGRCWERLGVLEIAIAFMKGAERIDPQQAASVLHLLQKAGLVEEAAQYAAKIVSRAMQIPRQQWTTLTPMEVYFATGTLFSRAWKDGVVRDRELLGSLIPVLRTALAVELRIPVHQREVATGGAEIAAMLGLCLIHLGRSDEGQLAFEEGLKSYPNHAELLSLRAIGLYDVNQSAALDGFRDATKAGARSIWPYFFLAYDAIRRHRYHDSWRWTLEGLARRAPAAIKAQLLEWLGISRFMLGQSITTVIECFDQAEELDPNNERIRANRSIVESDVGRPRPAVNKTYYEKQLRWPRIWAHEAAYSAAPTLRIPNEVFDVSHGNRVANAMRELATSSGK